MNTSESLTDGEALNGETPRQVEAGSNPEWQKANGRRLALGAIFLAALVAVFGRDLVTLVTHSLANELHSHIVLIPFITGYLLHVYRARLPRELSSSWALGSGVAVIGSLTFATAHRFVFASPFNENDYHSLITLSFILFLVAGGFYFLGRRWMWAAAFPIAFLVFAIPLPDGLVELLENGSKMASAEVANAFFLLTGTPIVRDGLIFQLPGIVIEVAQECSGIRSSWVLFITSALASYMFLNSPWRRAVLVLLVIPLGFLRNGFRILVIGLLCVHISPDMINSFIHRRGGPFFFILSLVPLFLALWWLRKRDKRLVDSVIPSRSRPAGSEPKA